MSEHTHHHIDYVEFAGKDLSATKAFYTEAFGWKFVDYGPEYTAFEKVGIDGGFQAQAPTAKPLVILYSNDLESSVEAVKAAGGTISQPIFTFPGGRRFHFADPAGNELAVWSET